MGFKVLSIRDIEDSWNGDVTIVKVVDTKIGTAYTFNSSGYCKRLNYGKNRKTNTSVLNPSKNYGKYFRYRDYVVDKYAGKWNDLFVMALPKMIQHRALKLAVSLVKEYVSVNQISR
jgi:hypothetical protein